MYLSDIHDDSRKHGRTPRSFRSPAVLVMRHLPIGLQIIGKPFGEETLLKAAYTFEQNTDFHLKKPKLT